MEQLFLGLIVACSSSRMPRHSETRRHMWPHSQIWQGVILYPRLSNSSKGQFWNCWCHGFGAGSSCVSPKSEESIGVETGGLARLTGTSHGLMNYYRRINAPVLVISRSRTHTLVLRLKNSIWQVLKTGGRWGERPLGEPDTEGFLLHGWR